MEAASLHNDLAQGPEGGRAFWLRANDGVRLRLAHWPGGDAGTILLFPGRTEYIEKYGRVAADLVAAGYHLLIIDWRGQGLSDRMHEDPRIGHVEAFADYQRDVQVMTALADGLSLPEPRFLLAHSMGSAIGLRALHNGLAVKASVFCSPMWKIYIGIATRPFARWISFAMRQAGREQAFLPGRSGLTMIENSEFEQNGLTNDPETWDYMVSQVTRLPELALGGPSVRWFDEAFRETLSLRHMAPPKDMPTLTMLGQQDSIIDIRAAEALMADWPEGEVYTFDPAEHELMMEVPEVREAFLAKTLALFRAHG